MRLAIVNHHGGKPAGAERTLMLYVEQLPRHIEPIFFLFGEGEFADVLRERYESTTMVPMSQRLITSTRTTLKFNALRDTLKLAKALAIALQNARADVVVTNSLKAHVVGSMAAKIAGIPCINYMHDILTGSARRIIREVSRFLGSERFACSRLVELNINLPRTTVLHPPIKIQDYEHVSRRRASRVELNLPDDSLPVVGLVGRILRWKGQDCFIRIASRVLKSVDAHFAIIGGPVFGCEPEYPEELRDLVARERVQERVHFVPWQEDVRHVYSAIDLCCNCSVREPFGLTTLEGMGCAVPAVCFDDAGVCEVFEQHRGGTRVPAGDEEAFAAAVRTYLLDAAVMWKARFDAREAARRSDVALVAHRFVDVIERVGSLNSKRGVDGMVHMAQSTTAEECTSAREEGAPWNA